MSRTGLQLHLVCIYGLLLAAGCSSPSVKVTTRHAHTVQAAVSATGSIFVVSHVGRADEAWSVPFAKHIATLLDQSGVRNAVQTRNPLAVQEDRAAYADEMTKFNPDSWLIVEPGDATVDRDGRNFSRRFEAGLYRRGPDGGRRLLVWRASVLLEPSGSHLSAQDMDELALALVRKLRADGCIGAATDKSGSSPGASGQSFGGGLKQE